MLQIVNSKQKGKAGERELVRFLKGLGFNCRRAQQYKGDTTEDDDADVVGIDGMHIECKRNEHLNVETALAQAERDSAGQEDVLPIVMWRRNRETWKATLRLDKFMELWGKLYGKNNVEKN